MFFKNNPIRTVVTLSLITVSGLSLKPLWEPWLLQSQFPVVSVTQTSNSFTISQRAIALDNYTWPLVHLHIQEFASAGQLLSEYFIDVTNGTQTFPMRNPMSAVLVNSNMTTFVRYLVYNFISCDEFKTLTCRPS
jgi:aminopeptidase N